MLFCCLPVLAALPRLTHPPTATMEACSSHTSGSSQPSSSSSSSTQPILKRVALLRGHTDSVICLAATVGAAAAEPGQQQPPPSQQYLASGAEDGVLCIHSVPQMQLLVRQQLSGDDAVAALTFAPGRRGSSGGSGSVLLIAGVGRQLQQLQFTPSAVDASSSSAAEDESSDAVPAAAHENGPAVPPAAAAAEALSTSELTAATKAPILQLLLSQHVCSDDIAALAINHQGSYLAAADDAGDVTIFDLAKQQQQQQQEQPPLVPLRVIKAAHDPLASAAAFRRHRPWQLLTAGMDSHVRCWDFSRPRRCCADWDMAQLTPGATNMSAGAPDAADSSSGSSGSGQLWNPPMVHGIAMPWEGQEPAGCTSVGCGGGSAAAVVPPALLRRVVAVARGDGVVAVFDAEVVPGDVKQASSSSSSSSAAKGSRSSGSDSKSGKKKGRAGGSTQAAARSNRAAAAGEPQARPPQQQQQQLQPGHQQSPPLQAGFCVCFGATAGGHSMPAAAVAFLPQSGGAAWLLSGGQDGRLLLWDWTAAFRQHDEQQQQQQQQPLAAASVTGAASAEVAAGEQALSPAGDAGVCGADAQQGLRRCLLQAVQHKRKVNALCFLPRLSADGSAAFVAVADTSARVSLYAARPPAAAVQQ